jgi:hypothetical protein
MLYAPRSPLGTAHRSRAAGGEPRCGKVSRPCHLSDRTRKLNVHNDLCQSSILATGCGAVRARRSHVLIDEMGRAGGI